MISSVPDNKPAYNQRAVFLITALKICTGIKMWCNKKKVQKVMKYYLLSQLIFVRK